MGKQAQNGSSLVALLRLVNMHVEALHFHVNIHGLDVHIHGLEVLKVSEQTVTGLGRDLWAINTALALRKSTSPRATKLSRFIEVGTTATSILNLAPSIPVHIGPSTLEEAAPQLASLADLNLAGLQTGTFGPMG